MDELTQKLLSACTTKPGAITFLQDEKIPNCIRIRTVLPGKIIAELKCTQQLKDGSLQDKFVSGVAEYFAFEHIKNWASRYGIVIPKGIRFFGNTMVGKNTIIGSIETMGYINLDLTKCYIIVESTPIPYLK